ncbi:MAG: hypothetical protein AAGF12_00665 [Myxococcota bacterium]
MPAVIGPGVSGESGVTTRFNVAVLAVTVLAVTVACGADPLPPRPGDVRSDPGLEALPSSPDAAPNSVMRTLDEEAKRVFRLLRTEDPRGPDARSALLQRLRGLGPPHRQRAAALRGLLHEAGSALPANGDPQAAYAECQTGPNAALVRFCVARAARLERLAAEHSLLSTEELGFCLPRQPSSRRRLPALHVASHFTSPLTQDELAAIRDMLVASTPTRFRIPAREAECADHTHRAHLEARCGDAGCALVLRGVGARLAARIAPGRSEALARWQRAAGRLLPEDPQISLPGDAPLRRGRLRVESISGPDRPLAHERAAAALSDLERCVADSHPADQIRMSVLLAARSGEVLEVTEHTAGPAGLRECLRSRLTGLTRSLRRRVRIQLSVASELDEPFLESCAEAGPATDAWLDEPMLRRALFDCRRGTETAPYETLSFPLTISFRADEPSSVSSPSSVPECLRTALERVRPCSGTGELQTELRIGPLAAPDRSSP